MHSILRTFTILYYTYTLAYVCTYIHTQLYTHTCILVEGYVAQRNLKQVYISHVAQVSDTAQVTRQVSLLGLIA